MSKKANIGASVSLDGEKEFKAAVTDINNVLRTNASEMALVAAQYGKNADSTEALTAKSKVLTDNIDSQRAKIDVLEQALKSAADKYGETDAKTLKWEQSLNKAKAELIGMEGELDDTNKALDKAGDKADDSAKDFEDAGKKAKKAGDDAGNGADGFAKIGTAASTAAGIAIKACAALATAVTGATVTITTLAVKAAGELEQNIGGSVAVFKDCAQQMQDNADNAFSKMGLSASDYLAIANKIGALYQGMGFDAKDSANLSEKAMQRAADVASIMGVETSEAMDAVTGMAKGNYTMMDNLGVAMNETALNAYALNQGLGKTTKEMSTQEKSAMALQMFLEKTSYAAGNYAKENDTLAGSLGTAKAAINSFLSGAGDVDGVVKAISNAGKVIAENINHALPRITTGITEMITGLVPAFSEIFDKMMPKLASSINDIAEKIENAAPKLFEVGGKLLAKVGTGFLNALPKIAGWAAELVKSAVKMLTDGAPKLIDGAMAIIEALGKGLNDVMPMLAPALSGILIYATQSLIDNLPMIIEVATNLITGLHDGICAAAPKIYELMPQIISSLVEALIVCTPTLIEGVVHIISNIVVTLPQCLSVLWESIKVEASKAVDVFNANIKPQLKAGVDNIVQSIKEYFANLPFMLGEVVGNAVRAVMEFGTQVKDWVIATMPGIITSIVDWFKKLPDNIYKFFTDAVPKLITEIVELFKELPAKMAEIGKNMIMGLADGFDQAKSWVGDKIKQFGAGMIDGFKSDQEIHSPSKKWARLGQYLAAGVGEGFCSQMQSVTGDISKAMPTEFDASVSVNRQYGATDYSSTQTASKTAAVIQPAIINVYVDGTLKTQQIIDDINALSYGQGGSVLC